MTTGRYIIEPMPDALPLELVAKLKQVETATVGHAREQGFLHTSIRPLKRGKHIAGCAITLSLPPGDSTLLHHALGLARPGDILVIERAGDEQHACWGGGVTFAAVAARILGAIIDGPCTDPVEIEELDFPLWCRGVSPITTRIVDGGGSLNRPVTIGSVTINAGDIVLADDSGILILGRDEAAAVAEEAIARQQRSAARRERIRAGAKLGDLSGASAMVERGLAEKTSR